MPIATAQRSYENPSRPVEETYVTDEPTYMDRERRVARKDENPDREMQNRKVRSINTIKSFKDIREFAINCVVTIIVGPVA